MLFLGLACVSLQVVLRLVSAVVRLVSAVVRLVSAVDVCVCVAQEVQWLQTLLIIARF